MAYDLSTYTDEELEQLALGTLEQLDAFRAFARKRPEDYQQIAHDEALMADVYAEASRRKLVWAWNV